MSLVKIHKINKSSYTNGQGNRIVVYFQGCPIHCPGCQNTHLWDKAGGVYRVTDELAQEVAEAANGRGVTVSGGEPFAQPAALAILTAKLRFYGVRDITVYTGYTFEDLLSVKHPAYPWLFTILKSIDVLVDGPYIASLDNPFITLRGSANQRPIDIKRTLAEHEVVVLDWTLPEITITDTGSAILPIGLAGEFAELGKVEKTPRCGQTKGI